ncbi:MAG: penicillin-binding transpeptidase domain-containing protein [Solirubrobacterales bacterium]
MLTAVAVAALAVWLVTRDDAGAEAALDDFLTAFEARDFTAAAALTDGQDGSVAQALEANVDGLDGATLDARVGEVIEREDTAKAAVSMTWNVPALGRFDYENTTIELHRVEDRWLIEWRPSVVHPALNSAGSRLGTLVDPAERAPILDRNGRALMSLRPVVEIGVVPAEADDVEGAVAAIAANTEADAETLLASIDQAPPTNFVPAIVVRMEEFERIREALERVKGVEFGFREQPLAPTKEFARALLGAVSPVTAEQLEERPELEPGSAVGQWGLQAAFEERLRGEAARRVVVRDVAGVPIETLYEVGGRRGRPLRTTLDLEVQDAAETALAGVKGKAAVVVVETSTGDVLAAANRPVDDAFNRAFEGQYPPGSTFKVISTAALLDAGLSPQEIVVCPQFANVGGKVFRNFEGSAAGPVAFAEDFAESCNTAFVSLTERLRPSDLGRWGEVFGVGQEHDLALPSYGGSVPPGRDTVERAASMIGQGRILASPLAMAGVAATVVDGRWKPPRLLATDPRQEGQALPSSIADSLRQLMRSVVTSGTGTALAEVPGEPIGKSGTAEYGSGDPPPTHAWFVAARDEIALAVLLEDRPSGGEYAAPVAARFFHALDAG